MIHEGSIPMNAAEEATVATLNGVFSITRRDPDNLGPLHVEGTDGVFEVLTDGSVSKIG